MLVSSVVSGADGGAGLAICAAIEGRKTTGENNKPLNPKMRAVYTPKKIELQARPDRIDFGSAAPRRRSIRGALETLTAASAGSDYLFYSPIGIFHYDGDPYRLARYVFLGPAADDEPIRLGIFAGIHGDESEGALALVELLLRLHREPERARGYQIFTYPICNPTGFEDNTRLTRRGHDLQRELWNASRQPEVYFIERELGVLQFHGVVNLRSRERSSGLRAHVRATTLNDALVQPALKAAEKFLPVARDAENEPIFSGTTVAGKRCEGELGNPAELKPAPFEITFETPGKAPPELQTLATVAALDRIIAEYRPFLASQQNL